MDGKMKTQEKLKEIVEKMIAGGCVHRIINVYGAEFTTFTISNSNEIRVRFGYYVHSKKGLLKRVCVRTLPDLLSGQDAMKALFGEVGMCKYCGCYEKGMYVCDRCNGTLKHHISAWLYHAQKAHEILLLTKSQDEAITYLYEEMKRA